MNKKQIRETFRNAVFKRDGYKCICCGLKANIDNAIDLLDAHHIENRNSFKNGGYCKENGASLCKINGNNSCHFKAEEWLNNGTGEEGYDQNTLYSKINSSKEKAFEADKK